jgi:hypothetical protein
VDDESVNDANLNEMKELWRRIREFTDRNSLSASA